MPKRVSEMQSRFFRIPENGCILENGLRPLPHLGFFAAQQQFAELFVNLIHEVGVVVQHHLGAFAALADAFVVHAVPRAALRRGRRCPPAGCPGG